jgi:hypothetical protein
MKLYDTEPSELSGGETPTLYQIVRRHKRTNTRLIRSVRDEEGNIQTSQSGIAATFLRFFQPKYENIATHQESTRTLATYINRPDSPAIGQEYETFFTHSEILTALNSGGKNRAPGRDGLGLEFYKVT